MRRNKNRGFTLVELIIVIAILAILAASVGLSLTRYLSKARKTTDISNAGEIANAAQLALAEEDGYSSLINVLETIKPGQKEGVNDGNIMAFTRDGVTYKAFCVCVTPSQKMQGKNDGISELAKKADKNIVGVDFAFAQITYGLLNHSVEVTPKLQRNLKSFVPGKGDDLAKFYMLILVDPNYNISVEVYVAALKDDIKEYLTNSGSGKNVTVYSVYPNQTGIYK